MRFNYHTFILLALLICGTRQAHAQGDSSSILAFDDFFQLVLENHPMAKQADLRKLEGEANLMRSRGYMDPKLSTNIGQKYFDDKQYYSLIDGGIKIPTLIGLQIQGGYEVNRGVQLNDQNLTPDAGLLYAGLSLPIGEGLFIDKQRVEIKKAKLFLEATDQQRIAMLNDLLLEAGMSYWSWYAAFQQLTVYTAAYDAALQRFEGVKQSAILGDKPFIDTVEASIQVQTRLIQKQEAQLAFDNSLILLNVYTWSNNGDLRMLQNDITPLPGTMELGMTPDVPVLQLIDTLAKYHPDLVLATNKIDQMEVQRRWNVEQLKPTLNLKYNPITEAVGPNPLSEYSINNYTWGLEFGIPLFSRKERGELKMTKIKIQELNYQRDLKETILINKIINSINSWETTYRQMESANQNVSSTRQLLDAERSLFQIGESSLFMVNSREQSYIKAQIKLIEMVAKNRMYGLKTQHALGILPPP